MATNRVWIGGGNNKASNSRDWSPNGVPEPGDSLTMPSGVMRIADTDLVNDELVIPGGSNSIVSLQNATVAGQGIGIAVFGNLHADLSGKTDALTLLTAGTSLTTVDLAANTTWVGGFEALGNLTVNGGHESVFDSTGFGNPVQGSQIIGSDVVLNVAVGGSSPFFIYGGVLGRAESKLEFGSSVAPSQTVNLFGVEADPNGQLTSKPILQIDHPNDFYATVSLNNFEPNAEENINLIGLTQADSYTYSNDILSLYAGQTVIDSLRLTDNTTYGFVVKKTSSGVSIIGVADPANPPTAGQILPPH